MKSPLKKSIGEVVTDYGARVMKVFKKGLLQRSLFDFYGDVKADKLRVKESASVPATPIDGDGGVMYTKSADGKLYYKSNEVSEVEISSSGATLTTEQVQDIVGDMFTSNTETRISATYEDSDGTIDLVVDAIPVDLTSDGAGTIHINNVPTLNQSTTGNAATATLATNAQGITGAADGDVTITSDGEVTVKLDSDNDESNQKFKITNNADSVVFSVQEDGVVSMAGSTINIDGSNSNLELNSGSDIILEADNAGGGNTSTIQYLDAGGTNRIILGADSDVAILSNRASNGTVQIRANTSTAGGSGEVTVVTVEDDKVAISQDLDVTGTLNVKTTNATGSPFISFSQTTTRRAFIQLSDNNADFENHLRIASEYGPVSVAVASTDGSDTDTVYLMVEPTGVFKFGARDADAVLTTDGNMTFRIDADNDETGQKFSFENNASTEVGSLDESGNLSVTGNVLPGITYVKILPSDFMPDDAGRPAMIDDTGSDRWLESHGTAKLFAYVDIPVGFKATHVDVYGSATSAVTVYHADINSKTVTSKGTGNIGTQINITDINSTATNYILIELAQASGEEVYGGKLTIAKI